MTLQNHPIPAVRAIIEDNQGRVLILRRANTQFGEGSWCLPGGKIDYGQRVEEAMAAEIREELSVQLVHADFLFYQNSLSPEQGGPHFINFYFRCSVSGDILLNEESSELAWVGLPDLDRYPLVFRNDEAIRRYFFESQVLSPHHKDKEEGHA